MTMLEQTLWQKAIYLVMMSLLIIILKQIRAKILRTMMILSILTLAEGRGGETKGRGLPLLFFKNVKKCLNFAKKGLDYVHIWVEFFIWNIVLTVPRRKNSKRFPCRTFFCVILTKCLSKYPSSMKSHLSWNISACTTVTTTLYQAREPKKLQIQLLTKKKRSE